MSKKVLRLEEEALPDFLMLGLITGVRDYKLCYEVNRTLGIELSRCNDIDLAAGRPGASTYHACFEFRGNDGDLYLVIGNRDRNHTGHFLPEYKNVDYFLIVANPSPWFDRPQTIKLLRDIPHLSGVYDIQPSQVKSVNNIMMLIEE
jgi:hypothetical protein